MGSSLYYAATYLKLSFLDPSVSYSDDIILFWDSSVKHWDDIIGALAISVESAVTQGD